MMRPADIIVNDFDLICLDSLTVDIWTSTDPTPVPVGLSADPPYSGNLTGSFVLGTDLAVLDADTIFAHYLDINDGLGGNSVDKYSYALIDWAPPSFIGIESAVAGDSAVFLSWGTASDPHPPITYRVYRAETFGGQDFGSYLVETVATTFTDNSVVNGQAYYYIVRAVDSFGYEDDNTAQRGTIPQPRELVASFPLDADPGWSATPSWEFGVPLGAGSCTGDPTSGHTGPNVYGYNLAGNYEYSINPTRWLTMTPVNLSGYSSLQLRFWRWLGVESSAFDKTYVQVSNNGSNWDQLWTHGGTFCDAVWTAMALDISSTADDQSSVQIRWGMGTTNNGGNYPGWNIDDVEFWGVPIFIDSDADGLDDDTENMIGSNPYNPDTDGDNLSDYDEYMLHMTDPNLADTDFDLASDYHEIITDATDPLNPHDYRGAVPHIINYQGRLFNNTNEPINGNIDLVVGLYETAAGDTMLWSNTISIKTASGVFNTYIGPLFPVTLRNEELFFGVSVSGEELWPRRQLTSQPLAMGAEETRGMRLDGGVKTVTIVQPVSTLVVETEFPRAFTSPPKVALSASNLEVGTELFVVRNIFSITDEGFTVTLESVSGNPASGDLSFSWMAHGN